MIEIYMKLLICIKNNSLDVIEMSNQNKLNEHKRKNVYRKKIMSEIKKTEKFLQSVGDEFYPTTRVFMVLFSNRYFLLYANDLPEVNSYLLKKYTEELKYPFSIIDITYADTKILNDENFTKELLARINSLFIVSRL